MSMPRITRDSLLTLEAYSKARSEFRVRVMQHKAARRVALGGHVTLQFEDELTIRYQVQEMLRIERIFEEAGIQHELDAYNPLIPDGTNLKATMMLEYPDAEERGRALARLKGIEDAVWLRVQDGPKIHAVADEDLERENDDKTSSVHFLRFELGAQARKDLISGARLAIGVDHPEYRAESDPVAESVRVFLARDLL